MSAQSAIIAVGLATVRKATGVPIVYHRGNTSRQFNAIPGKHTEQAVDGQTIVAEVERFHFLFPKAELDGLDPETPIQADWIEAIDTVWEVTETPGVGYWKYVDPARTWCRLNVTETQP